MVCTEVSRATLEANCDKDVIIGLIIDDFKKLQSRRDPSRIYLIKSINRFCIQLEEDFTPYLSLILPSLLTYLEEQV